MKMREIISVILALGIVIIAVWIMEKSIRKQTTGHTTEHITANQEHRPPEQDSINQRGAIEKSSNNVIKCIEDGRTIYSDKPCKDSAHTLPLDLKDNAGIVSPSQESINRVMTRQTALRTEESRTTTPTISVIGKSKTIDCAEVKAAIEQLDSLARQPQSAFQQDQIRQERVRLTAITC
jgi:hypothetical protein